MKTSTLLLLLAAAGVAGALAASALFKPGTRASLPDCPHNRYVPDSAAPSGWRCAS